MSEFIRVDAERERIDADPSRPRAVKNMGPDAVYYGGETVSSVNKTGTLTVGSSLALPPGYWFTSAGRSRLFVREDVSSPVAPPVFFSPDDDVRLAVGQFGIQVDGDGQPSLYYEDGA